MRRVVGDAGKDIGEPSLRVDIVHFCGDDQAIHFCRPLAAAVGACKQPGLSTQGDATKGAFGSFGQISEFEEFSPGVCLMWSST
jgi:hypothetical protein